MEKINARTAVLDGEAAVTDARGKTSFQLLQKAIKAQAFDDLAFFAFDVLAVDGEDLRVRPLTERKAQPGRGCRLSGEEGGVLRLNDFIEGHGADVQQQACRLGLEGMVSKLKNSLYEGVRNAHLVESEVRAPAGVCRRGVDRPGRNSKEGLRGRGRGISGRSCWPSHDDRGRLIYTGKVGTGFDDAGLRHVLRGSSRWQPRHHPLDVRAPRSEVGGATGCGPR